MFKLQAEVRFLLVNLQQKETEGIKNDKFCVFFLSLNSKRKKELLGEWLL